MMNGSDDSSSNPPPTEPSIPAAVLHRNLISFPNRHRHRHRRGRGIEGSELGSGLGSPAGLELGVE
ncbi:hypothetical protein Syun_002695 [Stephania yunnanensis]|uniref:Uncharacterized protein n=1 Tax=Stephania yunnanensis TaxID=152371 RepID=A0AAP0LGW0_9MAGN